MYARHEWSLPVDNIELVEMLECKQQLSTVEPATLLVEALLALEMMEELSAVHEPNDPGSLDKIYRKGENNTYARTR